MITLGVLVSITLIGNAIACMVNYNTHTIECNYIVYGGITLYIVGFAVTLIIILIKERIKMNQNRRHSFNETEPRIVVRESRHSTGNPLRRNSSARRIRRDSNSIV